MMGLIFTIERQDGQCANDVCGVSHTISEFRGISLTLELCGTGSMTVLCLLHLLLYQIPYFPTLDEAGKETTNCCQIVT